MFTLRHLALPLLLTVVLVAGCSKKFNDDSKVLATVNGEGITEKDYENYLQLRSAQQGPVADKDKEKKVVLDEMIDRVLLTQQGVEQGLEQTPDIHFRLKRVRENLLAQEVIRAKLKDLQISDDDVKKRFA
ncbi:MAG TPA: SurA N-terminal domain-containing protein, partial [Burkholderiaceae bacterium]|nr:SurA N-terminal domain-containing protein [Burkholderiaceae bacterium]